MSLRSGGRSERDRGSATVLGLGMILVLLVLLAGFLLLGAAVHSSLRARGAADAAALAGAGALLEGQGRDAACALAADLAQRNGARLVTCRAEPGTDGRVRASVRVEVALAVPGLGGTEARGVARAGAVPDGDEGP